jgi:hypothetical protein
VHFSRTKPGKLCALTFQTGTEGISAHLKKIFLFAGYHFGDQVPGECFRRLKSGDRFQNDWPLFTLRDTLTESYINENSVASLDIGWSVATETRTQLEMRRSNDDDRELFYRNIYRVNTWALIS